MPNNTHIDDYFYDKINHHVGLLYSNKFDPSKTENQQLIQSSYNDHKNIVFMGYTGTGKTMACIYTAYLSYQSHVKKSVAFKKEDMWMPNWALNWLHSVDLCEILKKGLTVAPSKEIFIDDFGIFTLAQWEFPLLERFFEKLYSKSVSVYLTTNLTAEQLKEDQYARILSRIRENAVFISTGRKDRRVS
jgi:DNA replication protein DnaC